jgi:hypothetical protein
MFVAAYVDPASLWKNIFLKLSIGLGSNPNRYLYDRVL